MTLVRQLVPRWRYKQAVTSSDQGSDSQRIGVYTRDREGRSRFSKRRRLWLSSDPTVRASGGNSFQRKMPLLWLLLRCDWMPARSPSVLSTPGLSFFPSLQSSGRSTWKVGPGRVTSITAVGLKSRKMPSSVPGCPGGPKASRVKFLRGARERPQLRCCHARPFGQVPANRHESYTSPSQSKPALFLGTARSSPFSLPGSVCL